MHYLAIRTALHVAALLAIYLSFAMFIPAAVDLYYGSPDWQTFVFAAIFTGGIGLIAAAATQGPPPVISARFGFLVVNLLWLTTCVVGAVPFLTSSLEIGVADAIFESASGITTTGGTVLSSLDTMPPGILIWRSLLQWIGGLGVIALGLFVLPLLNVGGISYFRIESSDIMDRPFARLSTYTVTLISIYIGMTVLCAISYTAAGMGTFNAVNHALTTISTAGFSTHDASMAHYEGNRAILWVGTIFMFIGALPFVVLILFMTKGNLAALRDPQIKVFAGYTAFFIFTVTIYIILTNPITPFDALTHTAFNFMSIITTTGYASSDYTAWGPLAFACAFVAMFFGGCSGSTTGGIKAYRFLILFQLVRNGLRRLLYPNVMQSVRYGDRIATDAMQRAIVLFISLFFMLWLFFTMVLAAIGLDFLTAMSGALTALTNVGPGLGDIIGPVGNFSSLPDAAKWVLAAAMLMGRLEILAVMVIFTPTFWNR
ncbi:TrkH family potassium uptake protein [Aliihoeflea sp. PC F10.4]